LEADKQKEKPATPSETKKEDAPVREREKPALFQSGYDAYMNLIDSFLKKLSADEEVSEKTKNKDISFQITFKDNEESCYMYFNKGNVAAALGLFPQGEVEVNLRMPMEIFDGMMRGTVNGANAAMTGKMSFTGNVRKAMSMQSILKLMMNSYAEAIEEVGDVDVTKLAEQKQTPVESQKAVTKSSSAVHDKYMKLIEEFLEILSKDEEVSEKTKNKDISFQITFKDNEEPCYMYFNKGTVDTALGLFPQGEAEVNLRMPMEVFDGMMRGTINGANAAMTGKMSFTGNVRKAMSMQSILKLMMGAYDRALQKVGDVDLTAIEEGAGEEKALPQVKAPQAVDTAQAAETQVQPQQDKPSFFRKLFGKKTQSHVGQADRVQTVEKIVYVGKDEKPKTNDVRDEILQITNELYEKGLITGIGGNISARCEDNPNHVWITPSSVFKGDLRADMMVRVDLDGNTVGDTELSASSEKMVHLAIYKRRPEIQAVIHSHAPKATVMALAGLKFLPISTDAAFIGDIPVVPFVIPGSPELGELVGEAIGEDGAAVIMQNHGLVVAGASCRRAADNTEVVESTAEKLLECTALGIEPVLLPDEAIEELAELGKMLV
jgi:L-ribulose-5-phosphate 4-epimerase